MIENCLKKLEKNSLYVGSFFAHEKEKTRISSAPY